MNTLSAAPVRGAMRLIAALLCALMLTVLPATGQAQPSNDNFADAIELVGESGGVTGANIGATREAEERDHAGERSGASVWYRWTAPADGMLVLNTCNGTTLDTLIGVYLGDSVGDLFNVASADGGCVRQTRVRFRVESGQTYHFAVDGYEGEQGFFMLGWELSAPPANDLFASALLLEGENGVVQGTNDNAFIELGEANHGASSTDATVWYRWMAPADGEAAFEAFSEGEFAPLLVVYVGDNVANLTRLAATPQIYGNYSQTRLPVQAGQSYRIVMAGFNYPELEGSFALGWDFFEAPPNDRFESAIILLEQNGVVQGTNVGASIEEGEPVSTDSDAGASIWYRWMAPADGGMVFETCTGTSFDTQLGVYQGDSLTSLTQVAIDDNGCGYQSRVRFPVHAGGIYHIAVDGQQGMRGSFTLAWQFFDSPANDSFASAVLLQGENDALQGTNVGATSEVGEPSLLGLSGGASVWYRWVAPADGGVAFATCSGTDFDTLLSAWEGDGVASLTLLATNDDDCELQSRIRFPVQAGKTYHVAVDGYGSAQGSFRLAWEVFEPPVNDLFANAIPLDGASGAVEGTNARATAEPGEPSQTYDQDAASVWYRWVAPADGVAAFNTCDGTDFDTLVSVFQGEDVASLTLLVVNDQGCGDQSRGRFPVAAGGTYHIAVDGLRGLQGIFTLAWESEGLPANDFFANAILLHGESGNLAGYNVGATTEPGEPHSTSHCGGASVWYRWVAPADGGVVFDTNSGADSGTLLRAYLGESLTSLSDALDYQYGCGSESRVRFAIRQGETYHIAVDGYYGAPRVFRLTWEFFHTPANDLLENATPLEGRSGSTQGTNANATTNPGDPIYAGDFDSATVWYRWVAPTAGWALFDTCADTPLDTFLSVRVGDDGSEVLQTVTFDDDGCGYGSRVRFAVQAGTVYLILVSGKQGAQGDFTLAWELFDPPANDLFANATRLMGEGGSVRSYNVGATIEPGEALSVADGYGNASVWYSWAAPHDGKVVLEALNGSGASIFVSVYSGNHVESLVLRSVARPYSLFGSRVWLSVRKGEEYRIALHSDTSDSVACSLSWEYANSNRQQLGVGAGSFEVAYHPNGRWFASAGGRGAQLLDVDSGQTVIRYDGHVASVTALSISQEGSQMLTGSRDNTAKLWDLVRGQSIQSYIGHTGWVESVAFSPDGSLVVTGSYDSTAKLWEAQTGKLLHTFSGHSSGVNSVTFSPDGAQLLTGAYDRTTKLWDIETGVELRTFGGHRFGINSVAFSPDGMRAVTGSDDSTAKLWDVQTGRELLTLTGHTGRVFAARFSPDGAQILTGSEDRTAKLWDADSGRELSIFSGHSFWISSVAFSPDGTRVLTGSYDGWVKQWDIETGEELGAFSGHMNAVQSVALRPGGDLVATGSLDDMVKLWDPETGVELRTLNGHTDQVLSVAFSPDGRQLLTGSFDETAKLWDVLTGDELRTFQSNHLYGISSVAFSPDGMQILTGGRDFIAKLWNVHDENATPRAFLGHSGIITSVAFSPDGTQALTGSRDHTAMLWNVDAANPYSRTFQGHSGVVTSVAFSPDGTRLVTGSEDRSARLWDAHTGAEVLMLRGHTEEVQSVQFSPDGKQVLTGSRDTTAKLWDARTGEELRTLHGHTQSVNSVVFSQDGTSVLTGSSDGAALIWELNPPRAIIVAGGGPYAGNSIARQTQELGVYTYRTLLARGYNADSILYLNAFPEGTTFNSGGDPVSWDVDNDGIDDVDGLATREALEAALTGEFATESGRLLVLMMDHGYRTGDVMAFRLNPTEAVTTTQVNDWLNGLQNAADVDVTLVVDCCYAGQFAIDCRKTPAIPADRQRVVIASTTERNEAVFLPAPDLTSFMHTFLGSAYMGNSFGEAFRSGARLFQAFPVAGQSPRIDDGILATSDPSTTGTLTANRQFFGASWNYGVQADKNINSFFPAFDELTPAEVTIAPGEPITVRARLLPYVLPERVTAIVRPPAPAVVSGEPVVGLKRIALTRVGDDFRAGQVWEAVVDPADAEFPFLAEGPYRLTFTAAFSSNRLSDPKTVAFTVSSQPDPDASAIRAVMAFGRAENPLTDSALAAVAEYAYRVTLDRFQTTDGVRHEEWIDLLTDHSLDFSKDSSRRTERNAAKALAERKTILPGLTGAALLQSIRNRAAEADRLTIVLAGADASDGVLDLGGGHTISAVDVDVELDARGSSDTLIIIDGPSSGSWLAPLRATGDQRRIVITSGRAGDCALFLPEPAVTFTHRLLGPLWSGEDVYAAHQGATQFQSSFVGTFIGTRIVPQLDDNGDGIADFRDGALARRFILGRSYAFAGDEASGLPFVVSVEAVPPTSAGGLATLRATLLSGIEPARDTTIDDPLDQARVYAQFIPAGLECGSGSTNLPRYRLRRESATGWTWSARVAPAFLPDGSHPVVFYAEYPDGTSTRLSELKTTPLLLGPASSVLWLMD